MPTHYTSQLEIFQRKSVGNHQSMPMCCLLTYLQPGLKMSPTKQHNVNSLQICTMHEWDMFLLPLRMLGQQEFYGKWWWFGTSKSPTPCMFFWWLPWTGLHAPHPEMKWATTWKMKTLDSMILITSSRPLINSTMIQEASCTLVQKLASSQLLIYFGRIFLTLIFTIPLHLTSSSNLSRCP